jgi:hypothetical protein
MWLHLETERGKMTAAGMINVLTALLVGHDMGYTVGISRLDVGTTLGALSYKKTALHIPNTSGHPQNVTKRHQTALVFIHSGGSIDDPQKASSLASAIASSLTNEQNEGSMFLANMEK